jgi:error-prone DNA polymerase
MFMPGDAKAIISPGARKENLRQRKTEGTSPPHPLSRARYAELHAASSFSFLDGASDPEDLVARAVELGLPAVALVDRNGVYGAPRFFKAARAAGIKALVGAEVVLGEPGRRDSPTPPPDESQLRSGPLGLVPPPLPAGFVPARVTLLAGSRAGYRNLCRLLTRGAIGKPKGSAAVTWGEIAMHAEGLHLLTGGDEGPLARILSEEGPEAARRFLDRTAGLFPGRTHVELQRHRRRDEEHRNQALVSLSRSLGLPLLATNGVRYATAGKRELYDVLTAIRLHSPLDTAGTKLDVNRERHLKGADGPDGMAELFRDLPEALGHAAELAGRLDFTLADLGYRFPAYPLEEGETPASFLRRITWEGARSRFQPLTTRAQAQISKELALIEKLDLAGYFLIVWDIVRFCKATGVLAQGRGSAANSAVCYALSITAVDPVKMELLFERFLSEERGEWPDIDLDLPSGDARESVIQYVYKTYGPHGAAMTANVITYRDRSAARETAKALGFSAEQVDKLAKHLGKWSFGEFRDGLRNFDEEMSAAGFDPTDLRIHHFGRLWKEIQNLPRHLGQHSGGMVVAQGRLDEVVPLEPAAMPGRVVIQWDKDDCADLGIVKVDLLGLGMLGAIAEMVPLIKEHEGIHVDLAHLPAGDPAVYKMLNEADTIGTFQVESRAQMASLPRNAPKCFYDIVIQVAIIRPGPIQGGMVHPFFDRRQGRAPVLYPHPSLEPILKRTLGVPLFQEQLLRIAMVAAGFTGGEAEELRRAMGFKRSSERMASIEQRLRDGMTARGITGEAQEQIVKSITSFALYGFPESHAASFALIAYASCWLKAHHPAAFLCALLNAWPMGFYHPATLVKDAERHGTPPLPIDVNRSGWGSRVEAVLPRGNPRPGFPRNSSVSGGTRTESVLGVRLGMRFVRGLRGSAGDAIAREAAKGPFQGARDLARRCALREDELTALAHAGALASIPDGSRGPGQSAGLSRRSALWQVAAAGKDQGPLYDTLDDTSTSPLPEMSRFEETVSDYVTTEMTAGPHLIAYYRSMLRRQEVCSAEELSRHRDGDLVRMGGAVVVRQRPGTAKGFVFLSLEDETGMAQAIIRPDLFREHRALIVGSPGLVVEGRLQKSDGTLSVKAERFWRLPDVPEMQSHDFR